MVLKYSSLEEIFEVHARLKKTFQSGITRPLSYRRAQLLQVARMAQENANEMMAAVYQDAGRHKLEVSLVEIGPIVSCALFAADHLEEWTRSEKPHVEKWRSDWDTTLDKIPKGVVTIISPWNCPYVIAFLPLVGAIASGCTAVLKPSEHVPTVSQMIADLVSRYLDPDAYAVINGGVPETTHLLTLKWDHIFFTGSTRVGRIVAAAAAKHLTPVTLELGGKCPVFIDEGHTDLDLACKRILWGKTYNSGQICVSPDYLLVPRAMQGDLVTSFRKAYSMFWPYANGALDSKSELGHISSPSEHARLKGLIDRTGGKIVIGGRTQGNTRIEPTIVCDVSLDDPLLVDGEIFGPILAIVPVDGMDQALSIIGNIPTPLAIYVFTDKDETREKFRQVTTSGSLVFNDVFQQLSVFEIPLTGKGDSGHGSYFGKYSFDTFTHVRGSINVPRSAEPTLQYRYPPYTEAAYQALSSHIFNNIPDVVSVPETNGFHKE